LAPADLGRGKQHEPPQEQSTAPRSDFCQLLGARQTEATGLQTGVAAATGSDYQEAMGYGGLAPPVRRAARQSYKARTGRGGGVATRDVDVNGAGRTKCAHASLASGSGRCMGYLTGQCAVRSPSLPLSSVSDTQLASRNPAAVNVRRQPAETRPGHQARCGQRTGRSFAVGPTGRLAWSERRCWIRTDC
jgi:hypothetical protein